MRVYEFFLVITYALIVINASLLIYSLIKKRISWLKVLLIVPFSVLMPYAVANLVALKFSGWQAFGHGLIAFIYTLFALMLLLLLYLISTIMQKEIRV